MAVSIIIIFRELISDSYTKIVNKQFKKKILKQVTLSQLCSTLNDHRFLLQQELNRV